MTTGSGERSEQKQQSGFTSVDCVMAIVLMAVLATTSVSDLSGFIPPLVQKVVLAAIIWQFLAFTAVGNRGR